jgi:hypothetical protein
MTASNVTGDDRNFCTHLHITPCPDFILEYEVAQQDGTESDYVFCPNLNTHHAGIARNCEELYQRECRKK